MNWLPSLMLMYVTNLKHFLVCLYRDVSLYGLCLTVFVVFVSVQDVLCGRGGLTNQHSGNEWYRRLIRSNRALYRSCPKHTKLLVAKAIVQAVQKQEPPGRFLEMFQKESGVWKPITYRRAVDKTSQALREKEVASANNADGSDSIMPAENIEREVSSKDVAAAFAAAQGKGKTDAVRMSDLAQVTLKHAGLHEKGQEVTPSPAVIRKQSSSKRKAQGNSQVVKPSSWFDRGISMDVSNITSTNKRMKTDTLLQDIDDSALPLPPDLLTTRQTSLFNFLSNTSIFGGQPSRRSSQIQPQQSRFSSGNNVSNTLPNPDAMISAEASRFEPRQLPQQQNINNNQFAMQPQPQFQPSFEPVPLPNGSNPQQGNFINNDNVKNKNSFHFNQQVQQLQLQQQRMVQQLQQLQRQGGRTNANNSNDDPFGMEEVPTEGLFPSGMDNSQAFQPVAASASHDFDAAAVPPPVNRMTTQVSGWLTSFWPVGKDGQQGQQEQQPPPPPPGENLERSISSTLFNFARRPFGQQEQQQPPPPPPPPPGNNLERSISSTLFNMARSPSQFLTNFKSGVTSMFAVDQSQPARMATSSFGPPAVPPPPAGTTMGMGTSGSSLLDDYEETPMETRLRTVSSK